jgi:hypothetical protein
MSGGFKFLVIADESPEFPAAAIYAGLRARATGSRLVMLCVMAPVEQHHWVAVADEMRMQAMARAETLTRRFIAEIVAAGGAEPEVIVREGDLRVELRGLLEMDPDIKIIVIAAGAGREGPGPLVTSLAKGQALGGRALPVVVVPGSLSRDELRALAMPPA